MTDEYDLIEDEYMARHPGHAPPSMQMMQPQMMQPPTLYPISAVPSYPLAQAPASEPILQRRVAGLPVWGWGLGVAGAGLAYWLYQKSQLAKNTGGESEDRDEATPALPSGRPSRTEFGGPLRLCLQKNGIAEQTTVYLDADEARKKLKQVSPLVTIQCKGVKPPMKELEKLAKRSGLTAVEHDAGVVGFYPGGGKKGKAWEEYIDALRDEGQQV